MEESIRLEQSPTINNNLEDVIPSAPPQEEEEEEDFKEEESEGFIGAFKKFIVRKLTSPNSNIKTETNNNNTSSSLASPLPNEQENVVAATDANDIHRILWTQFQVVEWNEIITKLYLIYCFANGLDIYDISNPKQQFKVNNHNSISNHQQHQHQQQQQFSPIFSLRTPFTIKIAKLVSPFRSQFSNFLPSHYPVVALVCPDQNKIASTLIRFYSLPNKEYIHTISMNNHEIYSLELNSQRGILIVGTRDQIFVYNQHLEKVVQFSCAVNSHNYGYGCMALADRWLAYPSINPIPNESYDFASQSQSLKDVSVNVAKKAASGLLYLGDVSRRVVQNVLATTTSLDTGTTSTNTTSFFGSVNSNTINSTSNTTTSTTPNNSGVENNTMDGIVELRDMITRQILVQFRAHWEPISMIQFDASGTLLATASIEGTYVNIFQIMPLKHSSKISSKSIVHLYKLYRGVTSAYIQNIQFSVNSKWVAVSSAHGTTHLFSIPKPSAQNQHYPIVCSALQRIHNNFSTLLSANGDENAATNIKAIFHAPIAASFYASKKLSEKLLISTSNGQLLYYNMEPILDHSSSSSTTIHKNNTHSSHSSTTTTTTSAPTTDVKIDLLGKYETSQDEEEKPFDGSGMEQAEELIQWSINRESEDDRLARWISNVETETYAKPSNPLWMTGQFKFKSFSKSSSIHHKDHDMEHGVLEEEDEDEFVNNKQRSKPIIIETTPIPSEDLMKSLVIKSTDPIPISKAHAKQPQQQQQEFQYGNGGLALLDNEGISRAMELKIGSYGSSAGSDTQVDEFFKEDDKPVNGNVIISEKEYKSAIQEKHFFMDNPVMTQITVSSTNSTNHPSTSATSAAVSPIIKSNVSSAVSSPFQKPVTKLISGGFKVNEDYLTEEEETTIPKVKVPSLLDTSKINDLIQRKEKLQMSVSKSPVIIAAPSFMSDDFKTTSNTPPHGPIRPNENFLDSTFSPPIQQQQQQPFFVEEGVENDLISFGSDHDD